jgi:hypothetical protein
MKFGEQTFAEGIRRQTLEDKGHELSEREMPFRG